MIIDGVLRVRKLVRRGFAEVLESWGAYACLERLLKGFL